MTIRSYSLFVVAFITALVIGCCVDTTPPTEEVVPTPEVTQEAAAPEAPAEPGK